jgi:Abortive infection alpha
MTDDAEIVKAGAQGIVEGAMKPFSGLIQAVFGPAAEEAGLMLQDHVKSYRLLRQVRLWQRTEEKLKRLGMKPKQVPLKLLGAIIDNASVEDQDDLQDIWANLLTNAADPHGRNTVVPSFPAILKELTSRDVKFLDALFLEARKLRGRVMGRDKSVEFVKFSDNQLLSVYSSAGMARYPKHGPLKYAEAQLPDVREDSPDIALSIDTFERQEIFVKRFEVPVREGNKNTFKLGTYYSFSHLGATFLMACRDPNCPLPSDADS